MSPLTPSLACVLGGFNPAPPYCPLVFCGKAKFGQNPTDVLLVVRGFANEEKRMEETIKAIRHIAEWREKVVLIFRDVSSGRQFCRSVF